MPGSVCRVGDRNAVGGVIINGDPNVLVNNRPVAVLGSRVSPHPCCGAPNRPECVVHCAATTTSTNFDVLVNGKPIVTFGDFDTCDHPRSLGSKDVIVGI
jgi:uncharacterized Zn-binding protein involved in type VI secretion